MESERTTAMPTSQPQLTGYVVHRKIGQGATATVWLARREDALFEPMGSENLVALKIPRRRPANPGGHALGVGADAVSTSKPSPPEVPLTRRKRRERDGNRAYPVPFAEETPGQATGMRLTPAEVERANNQEEYILSRFRHENLVKYWGSVDTSHGRGYLMEYAAGGSLLQMVSAIGPLTIGQAVTVVVGVARAVDFLHQAGVSHRDISPSNVLFDSEGKPLLADFGFAHVLAQSGHAAWGTPGFHDPYGSPSAQVGSAPSDVYGLGALLWFVLTGEVPGPAVSRTPLTVVLPDIHPDLVAILEAALSEDPSARPTAREFAQEIYRSHQPTPVDVTRSAHREDLPLLLTRRAESAEPELHGAFGRTRVRVGTAARTLMRSVHARFGLMATGAKRTARQGSHEDIRAERAGGRRVQNDTSGQVPDGAFGSHQDRIEDRIAVARQQLFAPSRWMRITVAATSLAVVAVLALILGPGLTAKVGALMSEQPDPAVTSPVAGQKRSGANEPTAAPSTPGGTTPESPSPRPDPVVALAGLVEQRQEALSARNLDILAAVNAPDSSAMAADVEIIQQLTDSGMRYQGLELTLGETRVLEQGTDRVIIETKLTAAPYQVLSAGATLAKAGNTQTVRVTLIATESGWRIESVQEVGTS